MYSESRNWEKTGISGLGPDRPVWDFGRLGQVSDLAIEVTFQVSEKSGPR